MLLVRTKSNFGPAEEEARHAGLQMAMEEGGGDAHQDAKSDNTVLITAAEMDGQVVSEVEIESAGGKEAEDVQEEPDVNTAYGYKCKKKADIAFEQQVIDLVKGESLHDDTDYYCHSLAKQFKLFDQQQKAIAKAHISQVMLEVQYPVCRPQPVALPPQTIMYQQLEQVPVEGNNAQHALQDMQQFVYMHAYHEFNTICLQLLCSIFDLFATCRTVMTTYLGIKLSYS